MSENEEPSGIPESDITVAAPSVSTEAAAVFRSDVRVFSAAYAGLTERHGLPDGRVRAVLADDFVGEVQRWSPPKFRDKPFTTERQGGFAAAKNLHQTEDAMDIVIVFNAALWRQDIRDLVVRGELAEVVAHELAHPLLSRTQFASGAMNGVRIPSMTPQEGVRSSARLWVGEYQADVLAHRLVALGVKYEVDGESRDFRRWDLERDLYLANLASVLTAAHPGWADAIDECRRGERDELATFLDLGNMVDQVGRVIVDTQAVADADDDGRLVLDDDRIGQLPATQLYFGPAFRPWLFRLGEVPLIPSLDEALEIERTLVTEGAEVTLEIYRRLGMTPVDLGNDLWDVDFSEPLR